MALCSGVVQLSHEDRQARERWERVSSPHAVWRRTEIVLSFGGQEAW